MTTRDKNIQKIKDACLAANPELLRCERNNFGDCVYDGECRKPSHRRPIRLADVLLTVGQKKTLYLKLLGSQCRLVSDDQKRLEWWDLAHDDLTLQSDETLEFIAQLV